MKRIAMAVMLMTSALAAQAQLPGTDVGVLGVSVLSISNILAPFGELQQTAFTLAFVLPSIFLVVPYLYWLFSTRSKRRSA